MSEATLYPILRRLEQSGAVKTRSAEYNGRLRRYFSITPIGKEKLKDFVDSVPELEKIKKFILRGKWL